MADSLDSVRTALASHYAIERELGRGGMATVYLAEDLKHSRKVAVKVLRSEVSEALGAERFHREIRIAANLQHTNIVPLFDSGEADGMLYYVMPWVEGETLRGRMAREGQLPLADVMRIAEDVGRALSNAHERGVIHRDIKPENIMLTGGAAVVADFGIARAVDMAGGERMTSTGISIGTPAYMSPEQSAGHPENDGRSDLYSFACVVYEMLIGEPPFTGPTSMAVMARHQFDPVPSMRTVRGATPEPVERAVTKALAKNAADRFASVDAFMDALRLPAGEGAAPVATPAGRTPVSGLSVRSWTAIGLLLVAAAVFFVVRPYLPSGSTQDDGPPMIVVLPFDNLGLPQDQYFADGITDEITTRIARISGLATISRTSAFEMGRQNTSIRDLARELDVDYVLAGSIRTDRRPDGTGLVRVIPHLTRVSDQREIWTDDYDAALEPGEIFATQQGIAQGVATALNVALLLPERLALQERPTRNIEAYEFFLRGNVFATHSFQEEPTRSAIEMYERAVALDPGFSLAWARLAAESSIYYATFGRAPDRMVRAREAAAHALAIDSTVAESRLADGYVAYWIDRDFDRAMNRFLDVRDDQPNNSELLWLIASLQRRHGQWEDALTSGERAVQLNPRAQLFVYDVGATNQILYRFQQANSRYDDAIRLAPDWLPPHLSKSYLSLHWRGDLEGARSALRRALEHTDTTAILAALIPQYREHLEILDDGFQSALDRLTLRSAPLDPGSFYLAKGDLYVRRNEPARARAHFDSARAVIEPAVAVLPGVAAFRVNLGMALAGLGRNAEAIRQAQIADSLAAGSGDALAGLIIDVRIAQLYFAAGDDDAAIDALEALVSAPSFISRPWLRTHPFFERLKEDPRFRELLKGE